MANRPMLISPASKSRVRIAQIVETNRGETPDTGAYKVLPHLEGTSLTQTQTFERSNVVKSNRMGGKQVGGNIQAGGTLNTPLIYDLGVLELFESGFSCAFTQLTINGDGTSFAFVSVGTKADATLLISANLAVGDTITIGTTVFTLRASASVSTDIAVGMDLTTTIDNIVTTLSAHSADMVKRATYINTAGTTLTITYKTQDATANTAEGFSLDWDFSASASTGSWNGGLAATTGTTNLLTGGVTGYDRISDTGDTYHFVNEGWQVGDRLVITDSTTPANDILYAAEVRIMELGACDGAGTFWVGVSDTKSFAAEAFAVATTVNNQSYYGKAGTLRKFFTHEISYLDLTPVVYEYIRGDEVNTMAVNVPTSGEVTVEYAMIGLLGKITETEFDRSNNISGTLAAGTNTRTNPPNKVSMAGSVTGSQLDRGGSVAPEVETMTINVNNNRAAKFAVGQQTSAFVEEGDLDIEMSFGLYFRDKAVQEDYLNGSRTSLKMVNKDQQDGHRFTVELPNIVFTQRDQGVSGMTVIQNMTAFAEEDEVHETKARIWFQP